MAEDKKKEPKIKPRCSVAAIVVRIFGVINF
jgi:hypothetical protein